MATSISSSGGFAESVPTPKLLFVKGAEQRELPLSRFPFRIGRKTGSDLEVPNPRISREHAEIIREDGLYFVVDCNSKLGTYVNHERIQRRKLSRNDRIEFGLGNDAYLVFDPVGASASDARAFLSQISVIRTPDKTNDLEMLALFLEAARKLNTSGALDEIMLSLIGTTLKLTSTERGFIYLRQPDGSLALAAACNAKGDTLTSDATISHSILASAAHSASEFLVTDTSRESAIAARQSIVAHDIRTVIAIPLRRAHGAGAPAKDIVLGVLYLDSHFASGNITAVSKDLLKVIAREAAALVESANLAKAEEEGRRHEQELHIASAIQQRLMNVRIPELTFASLTAKNIPCKAIGGDFFDVVSNEDGLSVVLADVSGKGISAAILASILQGMVYAQLVARVPLAEVVSAANRFLCQRVMGEKYATLVIVRVSPTGEVEYVNCGHIPPLMAHQGKTRRMEVSNHPVGLLADAQFESGAAKLLPGDRLVMVTDGVTEAEDACGEFFGDQRLEQCAAAQEGSCFDCIFSSIREHCKDAPLTDDCTLVELIYHGSS